MWCWIYIVTVFVRADIDSTFIAIYAAQLSIGRTKQTTLFAMPFNLRWRMEFGLDLKMVSLWAQGPFNYALQDMDAFQMSIAYRAYAAAQLITFEKISRWFFGVTRPKQHQHGASAMCQQGCYLTN